MTAKTQFIVGQTYQTRSPCDHDCIITAKVLTRTAHTVTVELNNRGTKTFRVKAGYNGDEMFSPWGRYSLAPLMSAGDMV